MYVNNNNFISPNEVNQSIIRSANTLLILVYVSIYAYFDIGTIFVSYTILAIAYLIFTGPLYLWSLRCIELPEMNRERVIFRIIGLTGDIICLSLVMSFADEGGTPLFFMYLWIIVANGIRYGIWYLIISASISIISFTMVVFNTPAWQSDQLTLISIGLFISLLVLPIYVLILISRLSRALQSEKIANQIKKSFLANMNHELRTPLNSILNLTELIRSYTLPEKIYTLLDMIRTSTNTQLQIVNGILDISRIEAGQYQLSKVDFDLYSLVHEVKKIILPQANKKDIRFYIYIDPTCNRKLVGAEDQIKQILINLAGNAVKFTDRGFVRITVKSGSLLSVSQEIIFQIEDSGIGISEQYQREIFEPFTQADTSITRKYGGTGLGVSISNELARIMGGTLSLVSKLNIGTVFTFAVYLGLSEPDQPNLPEFLKIYALNLDDEYSTVLRTYDNYGLKISIPNLDDSESFKRECFDGKSILIVDNDQITELPDEIINLLDGRDVMMIYAHKKEGSSINKCNSITSIAANANQATLINAISICAQFLPRNIIPVMTLPQTVRPLHILLVEDDLILREIYNLIFSKTGNKLSLMKDGYEALDAVKDNNYDLIILDLHLPGLSGIEVATKIKLEKPNDPMQIILLTADFNKKLLSDNKSLFASVLVKPIDPIELLNEVYKTLELPSLFNIQNKKVVATEGEKFIDYVNNKFPGSFVNCALMNDNLSIAGLEGLKKILDIYNNEVILQLNRLSASVMSNKIQDYYSILHQLKGCSMSVGTPVFGDVVNYLIKIVFKETNIHIITSLAKNLTNIHKISMLAFDIYLSEEYLNKDHQQNYD